MEVGSRSFGDSATVRTLHSQHVQDEASGRAGEPCQPGTLVSASEGDPASRPGSIACAWGRTLRPLRHLTPRYVYDRFAFEMWQRMHPGMPWITPAAARFLAEWIRPSDLVLEWGSGRSTVWFAERSAKVISVEHDRSWYDRVNKQLNLSETTCTDRRLFEDNPDRDEYGDSDYVNVVLTIPDGSLDIVLVDGIFRDACALKVVDKVRPGGILIIDNINWYVESQSRSPASRSLGSGAATAQWSNFETVAREWRRVWTTCGVTDTALYFAPHSRNFSDAPSVGK